MGTETSFSTTRLVDGVSILPLLPRFHKPHDRPFSPILGEGVADSSAGSATLMESRMA